MSTYAERPPPDPERFLTALETWRAGDDSAGTTMQALKRGGLDELLATNADSDSAVLIAWNKWEKGGVPPATSLEEMEAAGIRDLLGRVLSAQREVFGDA